MLTQTEAWAIRRTLAQMDVDFMTITVRDEIFMLCSKLSSLTEAERHKIIANEFNDDLGMILNIDPNTDVPAPDRANNRWQIIHASELAKLPKAHYLIEPFIIEKGLTVLFGPSGAYKSFAALDFALTVAQTAPAVYVVYEGLLGYRQRIEAWCAHQHRGWGQLYMVVGNLAVMDEVELNRFIEKLSPMQPAIVVLDTVARAMTGADENSTRDMGLFVSACELLQHRLGCAVLVVHHTSKSGIQERGSGALRGAADMMIKQVADDDLIIVECEKSKDAEPFETLYKQPLSVHIDLDGEKMSVPVLVDAELIIPSKDKLTKNQMKVLNTLAMEVYSEGATASELNDQLPEIPRASLMRVVNRLMQLGLVSQPAKRDPYSITDDGMTRLTRLTRLSTEEEEVNNHDGQSSHSSQPSQVRLMR